MRRRSLFVGLLLVPIIKMGTGLIYSGVNASQNETVNRFFRSLSNKNIVSQPGGFWEAPVQKEITADTTALKQSDWYANAINTIHVKEYEISFDTQLKIYSSPNRRHNLRAFYSNNRFTMMPRDDSKDKWKLSLELNGIYAGRKKIYEPVKDAAIRHSGNNIQFDNNGQFITEYINSSEGVRQNFIITQKPVCDPQKLSVKLNAGKGWYVNPVHKKEIHFARANKYEPERKITYNGLKAWDATGKELESSFSVSDNQFSIDVVTQNAVYPVTIDPISTTAGWNIESNQVSAQLAWNLASAGDVNGDGYSDVIVGSPLYDNGQTDEGKVFVYHGSATGLAATASWTAESDIVSARMGYCVNTGGDVNGDGYSDVLIGSPYLTNGQTNEGRAYVYLGSAGGLPATAAWMLESDQASAFYGAAVACAGDVNGDGYSDILVGSPNYDNGQTDEGMAFLYHGSASGPVLTPNWTGESNQANASYGATQLGLIGTGMASAGDVNGDGYSDIIISAVLYSNGETNEGRAFVYHGSASGLSVAAAWTYESNQASAKLGNGVAAAGDVNGDGYGDVIVGAHAYNNGQTAEGQAYVFYGSASGLAASPAWTTESNLTNAQHGCSVASLGDVNDDGYADIIVGELQYTNGQSSEGAALAYFGSATGLPLTANWTVESNLAGALFGCSVASAGDVNGDGYSDVIVGALAYNNGQAAEGAAFVYYGSAEVMRTTANWQVESNQVNAQMGFHISGVASAGDVNGDGYGDVIIGLPYYDNGQTDEGMVYVYHGSASGLPLTPDWIAESNQVDAQFGHCVASAGDVNGDGYSDIIIGAIGYDNGETNEGRAYVYHGSAGGLSLTANWNAESNQAASGFGFSLASAGDVNGDGYGDVIIGAWQYDNGESDEGRAYVYHGSASGLPASANWTGESNQASSVYGHSLASAGDVNGDGYSDVIVGAFIYDNGQTDEGMAFVYHGSASGLSASANWTADNNAANSYFAVRVGAAGDVNGDGYSDVVIGAHSFASNGRAYVYHGSASGLSAVPNWSVQDAGPYYGMGTSAGDINGDGYSDVVIGAFGYTNGQSSEGRAYVYNGSASGLNVSAGWVTEINVAGAYYGYSVAPAGDVNGDGFSDILIGAPYYGNGHNGEGSVYLYYGNNNTGKRCNLRLYNTDLITPIQRSNYNDPNLFGAGLYARSPLGRQKGRMVWEVKQQGTAFNGNPITNSTFYYSRQPSFTDLGINGTELKYQVQKQGKQTKIRVRVEYSKATAITGQVYGPWKYPAGYTMGAYGMNAVPLPLQLLSFAGQYINKDDVQLLWTTANEINMQQFIVERSKDGVNFIAMGTLAAKGTGVNKADYSYTDKNVKADLLYYRLKLKEQDGSISYSHIISLNRIRKINGFIAPNPVAPNTDAILKVYSFATDAVRIEVYNTSGQLVLKKDAVLNSGNNEVAIITKGLPQGMYVVRVLGTMLKEQYKLVIQ